ncbi:MAG TPA: tRNA pseudouridine(38-40) synthase TruA [Bacteroidota bacterium]|nr:tRNA pseudouridine(38-40) synthase TruA [Bacteroidota bacterium]
MRNIKLVIEYDGGAYAGWQRQAGDPTVQAAIENSLATLLREPATLIGAGRTDAGVHARGQVANFRTASAMEPPRIARGLNALLPDDIAVLACEEAPESFHARFDAVARRYAYTISTSPTALERRYVWHVKFTLDLDPMRDAAASVLGTHDFTSFCRAGADVRHHVCTVRDAAWSASGARIRFAITADRFLHGMVRALVGSMVDVGRGYRDAGEFRGMLAKENRCEAGPAAPARGLVLEEVYY